MSKFKWFSGLVVAAGVAAGAAGAAQASTVYLVSSTNVVHCGTAPHGLWTGQQNFSNGGSCGNYYDISPGTTLVINDDDADPLNWSGTLDGFAVNPQCLQAEIHLTLSDFAETAKYKTENGVVYDQNTDTPDIDFFQNVVGTIEIDNVTYTVDPADPVPGGYSFQWGQGANAKDASEFGGSVWLNILDPNGQRLSGHWDLNLTFEAVTTTNDVPEPGSLAVFGLGLIGLHFARRRRSRK